MILPRKRQFGRDEITAKKLEGFLGSLGWSMRGELGSVARIWRGTNEAGIRSEILVPIDRSIEDFEERIDTAIDILSEALQSDEQTVTARIGALSLDAVRVTIDDADTSTGTVKVDDGVSLFSGLRDLMVASARSAISPRKHHEGSESNDTKAYHQALRFGQTEIGSYVATIFAPLEDSSIGTQVEIETESFSRLVLSTLVDSLVAIRGATDAFEANNGFDEFFAAVEVGVSSNMCDAIVEMGGKSTRCNLRIDVVPSPLRPVQSLPILDFSFSANEVTVIAEAAEKLKEENLIPDYEIIGIIDKLTRRPKDSFGQVTVYASVHGQLRHVRLELGESEYDQAVEAHRFKSNISCRGTLHQAPRISTLLNPRQFKVLDRPLFDD